MEDAKNVSNTLVADLKPLSVVLFGSVAREGAGADLDLLIIVDDKGRDEDNNMAVHRSLKNYYKKFAIDPFVISFSLFADHYAKGSPFLRAIIKEGRIIYMKDAVQEWMKQVEAGLLPIGEPTESDAQRAVEIARRVLAEAKKSIS